MKKVLVATTNVGKIEIYKPIFKELGIDIVSLKDFNFENVPEEYGRNVIENAVIKAKYYNKITHLPVLANDSGLIINKLSKEDQPGLFVRRHNGIEMTDQEIIDKYIEKLNKVGGESPAYYNVGLAIIDEKGKLHTKLFKPKRYFVNRASPVVQKGIPLSSLAYDKKSKKYLSEMTFEERNKYEGKAFQQQAQFIKDIFRTS